MKKKKFFFPQYVKIFTLFMCRKWTFSLYYTRNENKICDYLIQIASKVETIPCGESRAYGVSYSRINRVWKSHASFPLSEVLRKFHFFTKTFMKTKTFWEIFITFVWKMYILREMKIVINLIVQTLCDQFFVWNRQLLWIFVN